MKTSSLQEIIRQYVQLPSGVNSHGWYSVLCRVCNDHGKKGTRAGFKFDQHSVGYNCFNCGHSAVHNPSQSKTISKDMIEVLDAFGIPESEWKKVYLDALLNNYEDTQQELTILEPLEIPLLPFFYRLTNDQNDDWCQGAIEYLTNRDIDWTEHPFYCVRKSTHPDNKKWYGRLIIPIYKDGKLIFYQGRDLTDLHQKKYLSATTPRDNVLYGYDNLLVHSSDPLYVVEGWFDAYALQGVALFGNKLTKQHIMWLNRSNRPKVIIPDRVGDGYLLAEQAIKLGWKISTLDKNDSCKDVNDSIHKHGLLYTLKTILDNTVEGNSAQIITNIYCEGKRKC